jgi:hypothetical protein
MARNQTQKGKQVKWAIAGRSKDRLEKVLSALPGGTQRCLALILIRLFMSVRLGKSLT